MIPDFKRIDQGDHPTAGQSLASGTEYINNSIHNNENQNESQDVLDQPRHNDSEIQIITDIVATTTGKSYQQDKSYSIPHESAIETSDDIKMVSKVSNGTKMMINEPTVTQHSLNDINVVPIKLNPFSAMAIS